MTKPGLTFQRGPQTGNLRTAALVHQATWTTAAAHHSGAAATKTPQVLLIAAQDHVLAFRPDGTPVSLAQAEGLCPGCIAALTERD